MRTVHLIVNPASRRGAADADTAVAAIEATGVGVERLHADGAEDVGPSIERVAPDHLVAVGGDGLLHHVIQRLATSDTTLGLVPSGTGNDFARAVGLPRRTEDAAVAAIGRGRRVDLLRLTFTAGTHGSDFETDDGAAVWVATVATAGFSGRVNERANGMRWPRGQQKYTVATVAELRSLESFPLRVADPDDRGGSSGAPTDCTFFAVGNTAFFGGGMRICPPAEATDGRLHLTTVGRVTRRTLAVVLPLVFIGQHVRHPAVTQRSARRLVLDHDQPVWADGEPVGTGGGTVEVVPAALLLAGGPA